MNLKYLAEKSYKSYKNPSSPIFSKIGGAKEKIKEIKRKNEERIKELKSNVF